MSASHTPATQAGSGLRLVTMAYSQAIRGLQALPQVRGKPRLLSWLLRHWPDPGQRLVVRTTHGFRMVVEPRHQRTLSFLLGFYEGGATNLIRRLVRPGDTVVDAGANVGYYSLLAAQLVGPQGHVHAFEPEPSIAEILRASVALGEPERLTVNALALDSCEGVASIHRFLDAPCGHSSLRVVEDGPRVTSEVRTVSLDAYMERRGIEGCGLLKIDVEGAEMRVLQGAKRLLGCDAPPLIMCELNPETSVRFGYAPEDLLDWARRTGAYRPYAIDGTGKLSPYSPGRTSVGSSNVVLAIDGVHDERIAGSTDGDR